MKAVLSQWVALVPLLLVYLAGSIAAIVFWRRRPTSALLVLIGTGTLLLVTAFQGPIIIRYLLHAKRLEWMLPVNMTISIIHALAIGLLLGAVFAGRAATREASPVQARGTEAWAPPNVREISAPFFVGSTAVAVFVGMPLVLAGASEAASAASYAIPMLVVGVLAWLYGEIAFFVLLYKSWDSVQEGGARTTPGRAIGALFVPVFNLYWIFQALPGFADDYNAYTQRANFPIPRLGKGTLMALAIASVLGIVPVIGGVAGVIAQVMECIIAAQLCSAINQLAALRTTTPLEPLGAATAVQ